MPAKEYIHTVQTRLYQNIFTRKSFRNILFLLVQLSFFVAYGKGSIASEVFKLSAEDQRLDNSLIYEQEVDSIMDCAHLCLSQYPQCRSINYEKAAKKEHHKRRKCQLNNETKTTKPEEMVPDIAFNYFEPIMLVNQGNEIQLGTSCTDLYHKGIKQNGVYTVDPDGLGEFNVRCDMTTSGGGWTVFQRRMDGSVDFYRGWNDYKKGFGDPNGEFWLGLDNIHRLSNSGQNVLRVDLEDFENETRYAKYSTFAIANETDQYKLTVGNYSGNAGQGLAYHNGMMFSTKDRDNDGSLNRNTSCAVLYKGAWWYNSCHRSNLNGQYLHGNHTSYADGVNWIDWKKFHYSLKKTEMKIRPHSF